MNIYPNYPTLKNLTNQPWQLLGEKEKPTSYATDLVILSTCLHRITKEYQNSTQQSLQLFNPTQLCLSSNILPKLVTQEDIEKANAIASFYHQRIVVKLLKSIPLTKFMNDLAEYLNERTQLTDYKYLSSEARMVYKLPYFYEYDLELIKVFEGADTKLDQPVYKDSSKFHTATLTFLRKLKTLQRSDSNIEYWFSDKYNNRVLVKVAANNPLIPLFENFIKFPCKINSNFIKRHDKGIYLLASGWELAF